MILAVTPDCSMYAIVCILAGSLVEFASPSFMEATFAQLTIVAIIAG